MGPLHLASHDNHVEILAEAQRLNVALCTFGATIPPPKKQKHIQIQFTFILRMKGHKWNSEWMWRTVFFILIEAHFHWQLIMSRPWESEVCAVVRGLFFSSYAAFVRYIKRTWVHRRGGRSGVSIRDASICERWETKTSATSIQFTCFFLFSSLFFVAITEGNEAQGLWRIV